MGRKLIIGEKTSFVRGLASLKGFPRAGGWGGVSISQEGGGREGLGVGGWVGGIPLIEMKIPTLPFHAF